MAQFILILFLTFFLDADRKGCDEYQISALAEEYSPRYLDIETNEDWQLLIEDLQWEVDRQCDPNRPTRTPSGQRI